MGDEKQQGWLVSVSRCSSSSRILTEKYLDTLAEVEEFVSAALSSDGGDTIETITVARKEKP